MERTSRLTVLASVALAGVAHAWLADWQPGLAVAAGTAFGITFIIALWSLPAALAIVALTTYVAPALLHLLFQTYDYHHVAVWLAALAGPIFAHADRARWHVPRPWVLPLCAWVLLIAVSWPVVAGRELDFTLIAARTLNTTNALFEAPPRVAAAFIVTMALAPMLAILWLDLLCAKFRGAELREFYRFVVTPLIVSAAVGSLAGVYQRFGDLTWLNAPIWVNQQRAGGLMLDANAFGTGAALWAAAAMALAWSTRRSLWIATPVAALLAIGMWSAGSRTALIILASGGVAIGIALLRERGMWSAGVGRIATLLAVALFVLAAAVVPRDFESSNPLERAFSRVPRLERAEVQRFANELVDRFGYGQAANDIVREHPVAGAGIGGFYVVALDYIYMNTGRRSLAADTAQNWWRHQLADLGVLGALAPFWCSVLVAFLCWQSRHLQTEPHAVTLLRGIIVGVGIASLVTVATQHPASALSFATVLFWLMTLTPTHADEPRRHSPAAWSGVFVVVAVCTTALAVSATTTLRVPNRAMRAGVPYSYGLTHPEGVSQYGDLRWMATHALAVMPVAGRTLQLTFFAPYPDLNTNPVTLIVKVDGSELGAHTFTDQQPRTFRVDMPASKVVMLEFVASRELLQDRALQVAFAWQLSN